MLQEVNKQHNHKSMQTNLKDVLMNLLSENKKLLMVQSLLEMLELN